MLFKQRITLLHEGLLKLNPFIAPYFRVLDVAIKNAQEDREISLQRERLRRRHMTGGEDSTGEDPLASRAEELSTSSPPCHGSLSTSEPVRLELGIDPDLLNTILAEVEEV